MITFKEYLTEARMAPLYHGTWFDSAIAILKDNTLKFGTYSDSRHWPSKEGKIISLTRDLRFAIYWARGGIVFEIDQQKLNQTHKIVPFNYFPSMTRRVSVDKMTTFENQFEESLVKPVPNFDRYVTKIITNAEGLKNLQKRLNFNSDYTMLLNHPLLWNYTTKQWVNK